MSCFNCTGDDLPVVVGAVMVAIVVAIILIVTLVVIIIVFKRKREAKVTISGTHLWFVNTHTQLKGNQSSLIAFQKH